MLPCFLKGRLATEYFPAHRPLEADVKPAQKLAPLVAAEPGEIGRADLFEIRTGVGARFERCTELVDIKRRAGHAVDPFCQGVTAAVVAEPDHRPAVAGRVAKPDRTPVAHRAHRRL